MYPLQVSLDGVYKSILEDDPEIIKEYHKGLAVFNGTIFEGRVEGYLLLNRDETAMHITFYPLYVKGKLSNYNLRKAYSDYFERLCLQANSVIKLNESKYEKSNTFP